MANQLETKSITTVIATMKTLMVQDQRQFNKNPTSTNWAVAQRGMLAYQQAMYLPKQPLAQQAELLQRLYELPLGLWGECIVRAVTGQSIGQILN